MPTLQAFFRPFLLPPWTPPGPPVQPFEKRFFHFRPSFVGVSGFVPVLFKRRLPLLLQFDAGGAQFAVHPHDKIHSFLVLVPVLAGLVLVVVLVVLVVVLVVLVVLVGGARHQGTVGHALDAGGAFQSGMGMVGQHAVPGEWGWGMV